MNVAIDEGPFDPTTGLFKIPGTDRDTSVKECIELNLINAYSATVFQEERKYSLKKAVENKVLDAAGHDYHQGDDILFDKSSRTYEVKPERKPAKLKAALKDGKILPSDIKVDDPSIGTKVNIMEAMSKGLISCSTGEYTGGSKEMNILEALKIGTCNC